MLFLTVTQSCHLLNKACVIKDSVNYPAAVTPIKTDQGHKMLVGQRLHLQPRSADAGSCSNGLLT